MRKSIKYLILALCCVASHTTFGQIQTVQYWYNADFAGRVTQNPAASSSILLNELETGNLPNGLNIVHIRAKDNTNWSVVHSQLFYKLPETASGVNMATYEYWVDNDFANRQSGTLSGQTATINNLTVDSYAPGMHILHIRAKDNLGRYSVTHSQLFYKLANSGNNEIVQYEYWLNNDFENRTSVPATGNSLMLTSGFDFESIAEGLHTISIRAKDSQARWSSVHTQLFYANKVIAGGENKIDAYRYWYDYAFENHEAVILSEAVNPYELKTKYTLPDNFVEGEEHTFHIQFRDLTGKWSVIATDTFKVSPLFPSGEFEALIALYLSTNGDEWFNTLEEDEVWDITDIGTVSDWKGVVINNGTVTELELTDNNLAGTIPAVIGTDLPNLQSLRVDNNRIQTLEAALPAEIALNVKAQFFDYGEIILSEEEELNIPIYDISRYQHSSGIFTVENRFDLHINGTYKARLNSSGNSVAIPASYLSELAEDDLIELKQYDGDAVGTVYQYLMKEEQLNSLKSKASMELNIYPNPTQQGFFVNGIEAATSLIVTELSGRTVLSQTVSNNEYVSIDSLSDGVYIVKIQAENGYVKKKIIKSSAKN